MAQHLRKCPTCKERFWATNPRQKYCSANHKKAPSRDRTRPERQAKAKDALSDFVGVDGEGYTDCFGQHHYTMLSVGDETLAKDRHLDFTEVCEFLWDCFLESPKATYVGFFLGYDFSQWLRSLPQERAHMLLDERGIASRRRVLSGGNTVPFPVEYQGWEFDLLGMKRFKLRKVGATSWMYVNDAGPFFQASFLSVIDPKNWPDGPVCTEEEYATILEGKSHRADEYSRESWKAALPATARYNVAENRVLCNVMQRYEAGLRSVGVHLQRDQWYGPGAAANAFLNMVGTVTGQELRDLVDEDVLDFARQSYYGGWFEVMAHGIVPGTSWEADVTSAYPHAMSEMPDWASAEYTWTPVMPTFGLAEVTVEGSDPIVGAMLHRRKDGTILRPQKTRGVYWSFELEAAQQAGLIDTIVVHNAVQITVSDQRQPLQDSIPQLFRQRYEVGKSTPQGKAIKLVLNSLYGKSAQSIGSPKHANALAASFITAHCRTAILNAIAVHPGRTADLLMVATDGVYFRSRPTQLNEGSDLGEWEVAPKERLTIVMPGVHYHDGSRKAAAAGDLSKLRTRGISAEGFAASIVDLDRQFTDLLEDPAWPELWPTLRVPIKFKVHSPKESLHQGAWERAGTVERDIERNLDSNPRSKRRPPAGNVLGFAEWDSPYLDRGVVRSRPYHTAATVESTPYNKLFGAQAISDRPSFFGDAPDGPLLLEFNEFMEVDDEG